MAEVTLVPRYGMNKLQETLDALELITHDIRTNALDHIAAIKANIEAKHLPRLVALRDSLDLLLITSVMLGEERKELNDAYPQHLEIDLPGAQGYLFSPTALPHPGKMSPHSHAKYHLLIEREGPLTRGEPVKLMAQVINPQGITSRHYHERSKEYFLRLLGKTLLMTRRHTEEHAPELVQWIDGNFMKVVPLTIHQLQTLNHGGVNLLCMEPYDPERKDHIYVGDQKY